MNKFTQEQRVIRAAGILEGEGSFLVRVSSGAPIVSCQMTDQDVILELQDLFGGNVCMPSKQQPHHKQSWRWTIENDKAVVAMNEVLPYMFSRRASKIYEVLSSWEKVNESRAEYKVNAIAAATYWREHNESLRSVANKFGISHQTVKNYANK